LRASPSKITFLKKIVGGFIAAFQKWTFINVQNRFLIDKPKTEKIVFFFIKYFILIYQ